MIPALERSRPTTQNGQHSPPDPPSNEISSLTSLFSQQYDTDDEDDLPVFSAGHPPTNPYQPAGSRSLTAAANPFGNATQGAYDSFEQSQNPAAYGGGQAANRFGTATDLSNAGRAYDDPYDNYESVAAASCCLLPSNGSLV